MIRITSKRDGFRRCGAAHPSKPTEYPNDRWSEKELARLQSESMLTVEIIDDGVIAQTGPPEKMTVPELKKLLDKLKVPYDSKANKGDLLALVNQHTAEPPEE